MKACAAVRRCGRCSVPEPRVTAVVATYNEERHVLQCLDGLLHQAGVADEVEILVVDGGSHDRTIDLVRDHPEFGTRIQLLENPNHVQAFAWNIGMRAARGRYVTLISAHTEYDATYMATCIACMQQTGASNVGGVQVAVGDGRLGKVIAWAMQSPFAIGNGRFRYAQHAEFVDHVFTNFLETATLRQIGGYDEGFPVNEDCELNYRLRKAGYRIYCSPSIRVRYHVRPTIPRLMRQMYRYGFWRRRTQLRHPDYVPTRVYAPPLLLLGLIASATAYALTGWLPALALPAVYCGFVAVGAARAVRDLKMASAALLAPPVISAMHLSYGLGWCVGFFTHRKKHVLRWPTVLEHGVAGS